MRLVGVTGGFCAGKTQVARIFKNLGAAVIDADKIVHDLYKADTKLAKKIAKRFGPSILTGGRIDRRKLAKIVFCDKKKLKEICSIIHPVVLGIIKKTARSSGSSISVIDAPLLIEAGLDRAVDYVIVVSSSRQNRMKRAEKRGFTKKDFLARVRTQIPLSTKKRFADIVIDNNNSRKDLRRKIKKIWETLHRG